MEGSEERLDQLGFRPNGSLSGPFLFHRMFPSKFSPNFLIFASEYEKPGGAAAA